LISDHRTVGALTLSVGYAFLGGTLLFWSRRYILERFSVYDGTSGVTSTVLQVWNGDSKMADILVPVGPADVVDQMIVLQARALAVADPYRRAATARRLASVQGRAAAVLPQDADVEQLRADLVAARHDVIALEADMRDCEARTDFGIGFVALARAYLEALDILENRKLAYDTHAEPLLSADANVLGAQSDC
jgi:hypothetical protein